MQKITIYTTPTCVYCKMAKAFFKEHNVTYEEKMWQAIKPWQKKWLKSQAKWPFPSLILMDKFLLVSTKRDYRDY